MERLSHACPVVELLGKRQELKDDAAYTLQNTVLPEVISQQLRLCDDDDHELLDTSLRQNFSPKLHGSDRFSHSKKRNAWEALAAQGCDRCARVALSIVLANMEWCTTLAMLREQDPTIFHH